MYNVEKSKNAEMIKNIERHQNRRKYHECQKSRKYVYKTPKFFGI